MISAEKTKQKETSEKSFDKRAEATYRAEQRRMVDGRTEDRL